jgi:hypothetical protein
MKKVVSSSEVCHIFANQLQDEARTATSNLYFRGKELYSYGSHFCIARFVDSSTLLFTERSYSNTTAKHISAALHAVSHKTKIYCAHPTGTHESNFNYWQAAAEGHLEKLKKANKPEIYLIQLERIKDKAKIYADWFKINIPATLEAALSITNKAEVVNYLETKRLLIEKEEARIKEENAIKHAKDLADWRIFDRQRLYSRDGFDYLRKNKEGFETSQGVMIPLEVGLRFYNNISNVKPGDKFLSYDVNEVTDTDISIGCHRITFEEIESVIK